MIVEPVNVHTHTHTKENKAGENAKLNTKRNKWAKLYFK